MKSKLILVLMLVSTQAWSQIKQLTLEEIWGSGKFSQKTVSGFTSMADGNTYTVLENEKTGNRIVKYDYKTGNKLDVLLNTITDKPKGVEGDFFVEEYSFSGDEKQILISTESEAIYRHSFKSAYYLYTIASKSFVEVNPGEKQQLAELSPAGNKIAFVKDNNIFVKDLATGTTKAITNDGKRNEIINGAPDWVYEEEFSFSKAWYWNATGTKIAYLKFDESKVKEFNMAMYGSLYPSEYRYKYPKAGEDNSVVSVYVYDVITGETSPVDLLGIGDQYIPRIQWTNNPEVLFMAKLNRLQNKLDVIKVETKTGKSSVIFSETSDTYVDLHEGMGDLFKFTPDGKHFTFLSEKDGYAHLYRFDLNGKQINQITKGNWDITDFYGIDAKGQWAFFQSSEQGVTRRAVYAIKLDGSGKKLLTEKQGSNAAQFSDGCKYFLNFYSNANSPQVVTMHTSDGKQVRVMEDNATLVATLKEYDLSKKEFFTFNSEEGVLLNGWMIKPNGFDASKKYPVFMTFYGGPGRNMVNDAWENRDYLWHLMLAQKGYLVVCVDNRGTQAQGAKFKKSTYKQLGKLELEDQIATAKYLGTLPYVDKSRIGCEGWSFGGYLSSLCITKGSEYFKMAIAVAPVTTWRYYDSIYTERFLQRPQENANGYDENSPINFVKGLKGKYLLVHGTADDNVHFQNSVEMVSALVKANKQFDMAYYPDKNHGIYGGVTRLHLFTKMTNFILQNL